MDGRDVDVQCRQPRGEKAATMIKQCSLCGTEMPERYNYCYQCGEYVGNTASLGAATDPAGEQSQRYQERVIHFGCVSLIVLWTIFGLWFFFNMNR
jgi:hypothetical protein